MTAPDRNEEIIPLKELDDFKVADGAPDVRGWEVVDGEGRRIGTVDELLVSPAERRVRYLSVELDDGLAADREDRYVLLPIGAARLDERDDRVLVHHTTLEALVGLPAYGGGRPSAEYESGLRGRLGGAASGASAAAGAGTYAGEHFDEDRFYGSRHAIGGDQRRLVRSEEELAIGKRPRPAGEVGVRKSVETEHVRRSVPVTHEEVVVERHPIAADAPPADARIEDDEIRVPVMEEEVVVEKRAVPKEEIVVKKRQVEEEQIVEEDLRHERVDVDDAATGRPAPRSARRTARGADPARDRDPRDEAR